MQLIICLVFLNGPSGHISDIILPAEVYLSARVTDSFLSKAAAFEAKGKGNVCKINVRTSRRHSPSAQGQRTETPRRPGLARKGAGMGSRDGLRGTERAGRRGRLWVQPRGPAPTAVPLTLSQPRQARLTWSGGPCLGELACRAPIGERAGGGGWTKPQASAQGGAAREAWPGWGVSAVGQAGGSHCGGEGRALLQALLRTGWCALGASVSPSASGQAGAQLPVTAWSHPTAPMSCFLTGIREVGRGPGVGVCPRHP